jgi:hypothetical protein
MKTRRKQNSGELKMKRSQALELDAKIEIETSNVKIHFITVGRRFVL